MLYTNSFRGNIAQYISAAGVILLTLIIPGPANSADFAASTLGDYGNVTVMEVTGNYDATGLLGSLQESVPHQVIAKEFFKSHKDEYDFLVTFTNFDFQMPENEAKAFYTGVSNDTNGIGEALYDYTSFYGSIGKLQGTIDMGNVTKIVTNPFDSKFEETLSTLSHEMMHRWGIKAMFKDVSGTLSSALLGLDGSHWSFLLDSGGSLMYGNQWRDNGNGSFTSMTPQGNMKHFSPLDLYLMGMIDKSRVPPMLLIDGSGTNPARLPEAGVTVNGTARTVTIDDIIAAMGPRVPDASSSQKSFKCAFILITRPGTFTGDVLYGIENIRNAEVTRFSILTDGAAIMQVAPSLKEDIPVNPGIMPPSVAPRTLPPTIDDGINWLVNNQKGDGSWMDLGQTTERETATVVMVLKQFALARQSYQNGVHWLVGTSSGNVDFLTRKIEALADSGQDTSELVNNVLSRQNTDGGWGSDTYYASNPADTALVLRSLSAIGFSFQGIISKAIAYLKTKQNGQGGWGSEGIGGMVQDTSNVLSAFNAYRTVYQLDDAILRGTAWLIGRQNIDGGYGNSPSTVYDTATTIMTLRELDVSTDITNRSLNFLLGQQSADGSWNESSYQTALAVAALYRVSVDPDLSIKQDDISVIPATIKSLPSNIVINAKIENLGRTGATAKVVLYDGVVSDQNKIGEQTLAFPGQVSTSMTFTAFVLDGSEHGFIIIVDPDNEVKESNKLNNKAIKILHPEATYDLEILPSDVMVSANPADMMQDVKITSKISNKGTMNAYYAQVKYFLDLPGAPFDIATQSVDIPAGATITNEINWRANKAGVNMPLTVQADPFDNFSEISKTNNKAFVPITVNTDTRPNLTISYKDIAIAPSPANEQGTTNIIALVKNNGSSAADNIVVNFYRGNPGHDRLLLGTLTIPSLASGQTESVSVIWANIQDVGDINISITVDPENHVDEIRKDDNDAFTILKIRSLPDFTLAPDSILFSPAAPKEGDPVAITVNVLNSGEQAASNVVVRLSEGGVVLGDRTIVALAGNSTGTVSLTYDTNGKKGPHTITATIDPDNQIAERTKGNNSSANTFGVQDANLWVTEPYFSPNGDGVKDITQLFFRLETPTTVTIAVVNNKGDIVRVFSGLEFQNVIAGSITWDGMGDNGILVADGTYRLQVKGVNGSVLGSLSVTVDTNRSPLSDAFGTKYLLNNNLTCMLPDVADWKWFPDESGLLFRMPFNSSTPDYPSGLYTMGPDGQDVFRIVPNEWNAGVDAVYDYLYPVYDVSSDGEKIAFILNKYNKRSGIIELRQLWAMDRYGQYMVMIDSFDTSQTSILDFKWSPRSDYLIYRTQNTGSPEELWLVKTDGTGKVRIDANGYFDSNYLVWSPDNTELAYAFSGIDANGNYTQRIRILDISSQNKRDVFTAFDPADPDSSFYTSYLEWFGKQRIVLSGYSSHLWLIDVTGNGKHVPVSQNAGKEDITLAPDKKSFVFIEHNYRGGDVTGAITTQQCDADGNINTCHDLVFNGDYCVPQQSAVIWSPDSKKIVFTEGIIDEIESGRICSNPLIPRTALIEVSSQKKTSYSNTILPFAWLSDGVTIAGYTGWGQYPESLCALNTLNDESRCTPMGRAQFPDDKSKYLSPREHYLCYYQGVDQSSICYGRGYEDLWVMSSLLNIKADLRAVQSTSAIILKGVAADLNFERYQLEYADAKNPVAWSPVTQPSDVPVINDVFTTWIPPYEGSFYVRLTVRDKAGNTAVDRKRVSWGRSSSITNIYKTLEIFSPNDDGVKDTVELHYRVTGPMHLEFHIYDENNGRIRTFTKDHALPADDYITWDGRDESGNTVPDGKYSIKVLDYEFFVTVDTTPPDVKIRLSNLLIDYNKGEMSAKLFGLAYDKNIKNWTVEIGSGDNPQTWYAFNQGGSVLAAAGPYGILLSPPQEILMVTFVNEDMGRIRGQKFRIIAEDFAGNIAALMSGFVEEGIFISDPPVYLPGVDIFVPDDLSVQGSHNLLRGLTVRNPLTMLILQEKIGRPGLEQQWIDSQVLLEPDLSYTAFEWMNKQSGIMLSAIRLKAVDILGQEYHSNELSVPYFALSVDCDNHLIAFNSYRDSLTTLEFQVNKGIYDDDQNWKDFAVWSNPSWPDHIRGESLITPPALSPGESVLIRMVGTITDSMGGINKFKSMPQRYPRQCLTEITLNVTYDEGSDCGQLSSGNNALVSNIKPNQPAFAIPPTSLSYFIDTRQGTQLLRKFDLKREAWGNVTVDTTSMPEGQYPVKAVLEFPDLSSNATQTTAASSTLFVDRVLPTALLTYPTGTSLKLCPLPQHDTKRDWSGIPVEALAADNTAVSKYELYYGSGDDPTTWLQATTQELVKGEIQQVPISGNGPVQGRIGIWDVSTLQGGTYTLKLKVIDVAGNVNCSLTTFSFDSVVEIVNLTTDNKIISPNGDGAFDATNVGYAIDKYATIDVKIFSALPAPDNSFVLSSTVVRTLETGIQRSGGNERTVWDGKNDAGTAVPDGFYGITVFATDACGSIAQRWVVAEVDNTPPTLAITYPKPGDPLGNIVEVKGSANDPHFQSYTLEVGQGSSPDAWNPVKTGTIPVKNDILGKWNSFGLEGIWTVRLSAYDVVGNKRITTVTIDLGMRKNLIKDLSVLPRIFSPNNDGKLDTATITYELTDVCNVLIELLDANSAVRKTYSTTVPSPGVYTYIWDGKDGTGTVVPDGAVSVRLTATLSSNTSVTQTEVITTVVDATLPVVDIKQPLNNSYISAVDIAVSGTISDINLSGYTINNGAILVDQASQSRENYVFGTLGSLPEGSYALAVMAKDQAQNESNKTIAFTVDRTPPVVKLDTPQNNEYYGTVLPAASGIATVNRSSATVNITGSIIEKNLEVFKLRYGQGDTPSLWTDLVTGSTITAYPSPFTWKVGKNDGIPDGVYTLSLYAKDKAGLSREAKVKVIVDNTPPTVAIASIHDGDYVQQAVEIKGSAVDVNIDKYTLDISEGQCSIAFKWATIKTGTASVQDNILGTWHALPADGDYCLRLVAFDKVGSSSEAKVNVKVDTHPPAAPLLSGRIDNKINCQLDWTRNTEPDIAGYNLYRNGQKVNTALFADIKNLDQNLAEGIYTYTVKAQDLAGGESVASNEIKLKVNLTGPDARIRVPQDGARVSGLNDIKGTAYSADDFKQYRIYIGQGASPTTWALIHTSPVPITYGVLSPWDTLGLGEGQVYSIKLEAEDITGNITVHRISVTVDNMPPANPHLISVNAIVSDATITWSENTDPDLAGYLLYRNDQLANVLGIVVGDMNPYMIQGTSYHDKSLPDGTFRYYVMAVDQAGNISDQSNTIEVTIDNHPPHAAIVDPPDQAHIGQKIMVKAESLDLDIASVLFQYQSASSSPTTTADWQNIEGPITSATMLTYLDPAALGLTFGDYRMRAVATDKANKTDPLPGYITVAYSDLTPPASPTGLNALISGDSVTLTWTANTDSDFAGYNVYRTSGNTRTKVNASIVSAAVQPSFHESGLTDETYIYEVTALDTRQNEGRPSNQANAKVYTPVMAQPYTPTGRSLIQIQGDTAAACSTVSVLNDAGSGLVTLIATTADTAGAFTAVITLSPGENKLTARATDSAGNMSKDATAVVVAYNDTPSAPTGLAAAAQDSDVHLTWDPNLETDILGYNVYRDGVKINKSDALFSSQATVTASSSASVQNAPATAMDSNLSSCWMPMSGPSGDKRPWWEMDLIAPELINHVELYWGTDLDISGNEILYAGKDFEIQVWSGYAWITQVKVAGNTKKDNLFDFKPSYWTDRIRLIMTDPTDGDSPKQVRLAEVAIAKDNTVAATTFEDLNIQNKQYTYEVTAVDHYGFESALSSAVQATISIAPPSEPAILTVSAAQAGLEATWVYTGSPASGFNLYRSKVTGGPYTKINSSIITETSFLDRNILIGVTYYYVLTVVDGAGNEGVYSNEALGTPPTSIAPAKPVIFSPTLAGIPKAVFSNTIDVYGSTNPGSSVSLMGNGINVSIASALPDDVVRSTPLEYDGYGEALSPDGKTLAYTYNNFIWLKSLVTGSVKRAVQARECYTIVWSPDSRTFAYSYNYDNDWNYRINIFDITNGSSVPLTSDENVYEDYPFWYPDGDKVLFIQARGASSGIYIKDLVSGNVSLVVSSAAPGYPKLSPDGKHLSYFDSQSLYLYDLNNNAGQTIDTSTDGWSNEWSPDGKTLAFVSNRNGSGDLFLMNIADGKQTLVPGSNGGPYYPTWTADGRQIVFDIWDNTSNRDYVWMTDVNELSQPERIMPDLQVVCYVGSSRIGSIAFIEQNLQGAYIAHLLDPKGTFSFSGVSLAPGENIFSTMATDSMGNRSAPSDTISVTYNTRMMPDLSVSLDDIYLYPPYPIVGDQMAVNVVIWNTGLKAIPNADVTVYIWNALNQLELLKSETIPAIAAGSPALISATWDSAGKTGTNRLIVVVDANDMIAESDETNNMAIKDFFAADHVGMSMIAGLDNSQYTSNQTANVSVAIRNTGPAMNTILEVRIEDANGYPVSSFDPRALDIAYANETTQFFNWNTGATYAGPYVVHALLKDVSGTMLAEHSSHFTIVSDASCDLTVVTDRTSYGPQENVLTSFTIKNSGKNYIIPILQAKVSVTDNAGLELFQEVKTTFNFMPGASVDLSYLWNTGLTIPGEYKATVEISFEGGYTVTKSAAFKINSSLVITGTINASPAVVPVGNETQVTYILMNRGNYDVFGCTSRMLIIDPETQTVMQTQDDTDDIAKNGSMSRQVTVNTNGYSLKTYTAVLQAVNQGITKNIANTLFIVKDLTPPVISIITPTANSIHSSSVAISVRATDNAAGVDRVEYQLDNGPWRLLPATDPVRGQYGAAWDPIPPNNGNHVIGVRATDKAGNTSTPVSIGTTIRIQTDTTPPTGSVIINNGAAYTNNGMVTLTLSCTDPESGCSMMQFSSDSVTWTVQEAYGPTRIWQLSSGDGPKTISVKYTDAAENTSIVSSATITLDTTPPTVTIDPVKTPTNISSQVLTGTTEMSSTITVSCATAVVHEVSYNTNKTWQVVVDAMSEGSNTVSVTALDLASNISGTVSTAIVLDRTTPKTMASPLGGLYNKDQSVKLTTDEPSTIYFTIDGTTPTTSSIVYSAPLNVTSSTVLNYFAQDLAMNSESFNTQTYTIDTTPPVVSIGLPSADLTRGGDVTYTVTYAGADNVTLEAKNVTLNSTGTAAGYVSVTGTGNGTRTVSISSIVGDGTLGIAIGAGTASDLAGNEAAGSGPSATFIVDNTPPSLMLSTLADGWRTNNATLNIAGTARDVNGIQRLIISGQTVTPSTSDNVNYTFSYPVTLATGSNFITTSAADMVENTTFDTRNIILDQTAPIITIIDPADNSVTSSTTVKVEGTTDKTSTVRISVNSGPTVTAAIDATNFSVPVSLLTNTANTINVYAFDLADNHAMAKRSVTNDETNPALAITVPNQDMGTNQTGIVLSGKISDLTEVTLLASCPTASIEVISRPTTTTWSTTVTNMQPGLNLFTIKATDQAEHSTSAVRNIIYTATPITINPVKSPTNVNSQTIIGIREQNATVSIASSIATVGTVTYPSTTTWQTDITLMTEGTSTIQATATDLEGNISDPVYAAIILDTHAPITTPNPAAGTYLSAISVTLTTNEPSTIYYTTDGSTPTTSSSRYTSPIVISTSTTINFFSIDLAGNPETIKTAIYTVAVSNPLSITTTTLPSGTTCNTYNQTLTATGGTKPYTWSKIVGLPGGLSLNCSTGAISGKPTAAGTYTFPVQVKDAKGATNTKSLSITISGPLTISTSSLPAGMTGIPYNQTLAAAGGTTPYAWSKISGSLPAGLSLNSSTGAISGTPTTAGTFNFTAKVKDAKNATSTKSLSLTIYSPLTIVTSSLPAGTIGSTYCQTLAATGGKSPYTWTIITGSLPVGLSLAVSTGKISGTPTLAGTLTFTVQVKDANNNSTTKSLSISNVAPLAISTSSLTAGTKGTAYSQTLVAMGGMSPYTWSISSGSLPAGLKLANSTGVISGTPTTRGKSSFTVKVTDANGKTAAKVFFISVN